MPANKYTTVVGTKFKSDGSARDFPGNTIICFINPQAPAYEKAEWIQQELQKYSFAYKFSLLPPSSFHMTVFELLCDQNRQLDQWSTELPLDASISDADTFFTEVVSTIPAPDNFRMKYWKLEISGDTIAIYLKPSDEHTRQTLKQYRDAVSKVTGVRFPNQDSYIFHISLAYRIMNLSDTEEALLQQFVAGVDEKLTDSFGILNTGKPMLTFFDNMLKFVSVKQRHTLRTRKPTT